MSTLEEVLDYDGIGDFMDLDDIIVTNTQISCVTEVPLRRLGFLDKSCSKENVDARTKLDLPLWMVETFTRKRKNICTPFIPKGYRIQDRNVLDADATVVPLPHLTPNFYEFGIHILRLNIRDAEAIGTSLITSFQSRFRLISKMAFGSRSGSQYVEKLLRKMDDSELKLSTLIGEAAMEQERWRENKRRENPNKLMARYLRSRREDAKSNPV